MNCNLLRAAMAEKGMTQAQLARAIGISPNSLSRKLNGRRDFLLSEVVAISDVLELQAPQAIFLPRSSQICND
ncbi:MAG: helix-turn-helix transcriptional regulator [Oscillospiraceae bacterium]|nr:helix-turn-helix transcriptional regulator [Oscillospiraceae bacterium]